MAWKCPQCEAEIDYLEYSVDTRERGTASLSDNYYVERYDRINEHQSDESEWIGDCEYFCHECGDEVSIRELLWSGAPNTSQVIPEVVQEEKEPEEIPDIVKPNKDIQCKDNRNTESTTMICKGCFHPFVYITRGDDHWSATNGIGEFFDCPKCGRQNSQIEYHKLLQAGYFNKIKIIKLKKRHVIKKTASRCLKSLGISTKPTCSEILRHKSVQANKSG